MRMTLAGQVTGGHLSISEKITFYCSLEDRLQGRYVTSAAVCEVPPPPSRPARSASPPGRNIDLFMAIQIFTYGTFAGVAHDTVQSGFPSHILSRKGTRRQSLEAKRKY